MKLQTFTIAAMTCAAFAFTASSSRAAESSTDVQSKRLRVIMTSDFPPFPVTNSDPDDVQSMVRFLLYANEFDIEGLIASAGTFGVVAEKKNVLAVLDEHDKVDENLRKHDPKYPTADALRAVTFEGKGNNNGIKIQWGCGKQSADAIVGKSKDSLGSGLIIAAADRNDPRPFWVQFWGGGNNLAQAIWKVKHTRSAAELARFLGKLRVFDILGQDDAGAWMAKNLPELFFIRATGVYGWQPPKNGSYQRTDIQSHGPLGAVYPDTKWATEGDTPAFMHVYPNGLNDSEKIDQGGWGGRFSLEKKAGIRSMSEVAKINKEAKTQYDPYYVYGNTSEKADAIKRWSKGYDNDFAARMDWSITSNYADANHHPIAVLNSDTSRRVLEVSAAPGSTVKLDANCSSDPDNNALDYAWSFYKEPSSYGGSVKIENSSSSTATVSIPSDAGGKNIHVILELYDNGSPSLYAYRRAIIKVK